MSDLIERLKRLEGVLLDQCNGNEGHPSYYSAEVVHRAAEQIESLRRENRELRDAICSVSHKVTWIGEPGAPGWCLGCGKHRSLIRDLLGEQG